MEVLDLFSGIGGMSLGLERAGMKTKAFCEIDEACLKVLNRHWPCVPIYGDVRHLTADQVGSVDVVAGGFPCQPFSYAGKRRGDEDERSLGGEMLRLCSECKPRWIIAENVAGFVTAGLSEFCSDLEGRGYEVWPIVIPAESVGARHRRDRVWIVGRRASSEGRLKDGAAKSGSRSLDQRPDTRAIREVAQGSTKLRANRDVSHAHSERGCMWEAGEQDANHARKPSISQRWDSEGIESRVGRVVDGFPSRVDRLRGIGNAVVPLIPELIGNAIQNYEETQHVLAT